MDCSERCQLSVAMSSHLALMPVLPPGLCMHCCIAWRGDCASRIDRRGALKVHSRPSYPRERADGRRETGRTVCVCVRERRVVWCVGGGLCVCGTVVPKKVGMPLVAGTLRQKQ